MRTRAIENFWIEVWKREDFRDSPTNSYFYDYKITREIIELLREEAKERSSGEFIIAFTHR